jgi:hypothetical protein
LEVLKAEQRLVINVGDDFAGNSLACVRTVATGLKLHYFWGAATGYGSDLSHLDCNYSPL